MWHALAGLDIRRVRLTDAKDRSHLRFCNVFERWLHLVDEHVARQPSGQVRRIPTPYRLLVYLLGGRSLRERLWMLCRSASLIEILTSRRQAAIQAKACFSSTKSCPEAWTQTIR